MVGAIVPWNVPFEVTINKLGQSLATGNTVILKAAPNTPWNATRIGRLVAEQTDFPPGVLQVITTSDNAVAEDLVIDPRVDLISFTGSTAVGRRIMEKGAPTLKRLFLELGGKSADIILDDTDFEAKLSMAWTSACTAGRAASCSRGCCCPGRATTRASPSSRRASATSPTATHRHGQHSGAADQRAAA